LILEQVVARDLGPYGFDNDADASWTRLIDRVQDRTNVSSLTRWAGFSSSAWWISCCHAYSCSR